jgi:exosome complex RNA-binding protein Csl4
MIFPGQNLCPLNTHLPGANTYPSHGHIFSSITGTIQITGNVISVVPLLNRGLERGVRLLAEVVRIREERVEMELVEVAG